MHFQFSFIFVLEEVIDNVLPGLNEFNRMWNRCTEESINTKILTLYRTKIL